MRQVEPGQIVQPGRALLSLALDGPRSSAPRWTSAFLGQLQWGKAPAWWPTRLRASALLRKCSLSPLAVDAQRGAIEVKLAVRPPVPAYLREDMTLSVQVQTARLDSALAPR